jgi:hypothetical protein
MYGLGNLEAGQSSICKVTLQVMLNVNIVERYGMNNLTQEQVREKRINAFWNGVLLNWYFSGKYWYCGTAKRNAKVNGITCRKSGSGNNKDEAFQDFRNANGVYDCQPQEKAK